MNASDVRNPTQTPSSRQAFWAGVRETLPLVIGAIPFGILFGALGVASGLSAAGTQAMSTFVFAGSAQFIALGLVADGAGVPLIVFTTLVVNARHMLYGVSLAPFLRRLPQRWLAPSGFALTDETFVVTVTRYQKGMPAAERPWFFLGSALFMYTNWQLCTFIGLQAGQAIPDPLSWGLDFAMIVTFIGMLIPLIQGRAVVFAVLVSAGTALAANPLPHRLGLLAAALAGVIAGVVAERVYPGESEPATDPDSPSSEDR